MTVTHESWVAHSAEYKMEKRTIRKESKIPTEIEKRHGRLLIYDLATTSLLSIYPYSPLRVPHLPHKTVIFPGISQFQRDISRLFRS